MMLARLLQEGMLEFRVLEVAIRQFGCDRKTARGYLSRARKIILKCIEKPYELLLAESVAYWQSAIADTQASRADRNNARRNLDNLLGLQAPKHIFLHNNQADADQTAAEERRRVEDALRNADPDAMRAILDLRNNVQSQLVIDVERADEEAADDEDDD